MQKVITISGYTNIMDTDKNELFVETEYPILNKYLADGYIVVQSIPILKPADTTNTYAITFILGKR